jgi:hypothetical protein
MELTHPEALPVKVQIPPKSLSRQDHFPVNNPLPVEHPLPVKHPLPKHFSPIGVQPSVLTQCAKY